MLEPTLLVWAVKADDELHFIERPHRGNLDEAYALLQFESERPGFLLGQVLTVAGAILLTLAS